MKFMGRLTSANGAFVEFDFEADDNGLASAHIAHVAMHVDAVAIGTVGGEQWSKPPAEGGVSSAHYHRLHAVKWHVAWDRSWVKKLDHSTGKWEDEA